MPLNMQMLLPTLNICLSGLSNTTLPTCNSVFTSQKPYCSALSSRAMASKKHPDKSTPKPVQKADTTQSKQEETRAASEDQSTDGPVVDHISEKQPPSSLTKRQKAWKHCRKFYLWYLLAVIVFLVIFFPVL